MQTTARKDMGVRGLRTGDAGVGVQYKEGWIRCYHVSAEGKAMV